MNKKKQLDYNFYVTDCQVIPGKSFKVVERIARRNFDKIKVKTKKTPYVRSAYFKKEKIFLTIFWSHLHQRREKEKVRRLRYFDCAIDLIRFSRYEPAIKPDPNNNQMALYRFSGKTRSGEIFYVQIKRNNKTNKKYLISMFSEN